LGVGGVKVSSVVAGSPADKSGIRRGDVIVKFNGKEVKDPSELALEVAWTPVGAKAEVLIRRRAETLELTVTIGLRPATL
jgi:serine protease Do